MKYFTADFHFYHENIITFCNRPYKNANEMNVQLIENVNKVVKPTDELYILGDFGFFKDGGVDRMKRLVNKINGLKYLILGNHDNFKPFTYINAGFARVHTSIEVNGMELVHDPAMAIIDKSKLFLCGHVHDSYVTCKSNILNVGVDCWNYKPLSLYDINFIIDKAKHEGDIILKGKN